MAHQVIIPAAGDSITSANVAEWHVADGDFVNKGQNLVTLETDKVSNELEAEVSGVIKITVPEGEEVDIGAVIAEIDESAQSDASQDAPAAEKAPAESVAGTVESADPIDIVVPAAGDSITSANIGSWHKADGDTVAKGDTLVTLETDKVSNELEAESAGTLKIIVEEGEEVEIGALIAQLIPGAGAPAASKAATPAPKAEAAVALAKKTETKAAPTSKPSSSPALKPNLSAASGSGKSSSGKSEPVSDGRTTRKKMTMLRRKIAQHLVNAQHTSAILTTFNEVDMTEVMKLRKTVQEEFVAKHGVKLGFMSLFVKAVVQALKDVPQINGRIDGTDVIQNHYYDIGVAIGSEKGLVVPVLRDPDQKSFADIENDIRHYAKKANDGGIQLEDLQGGVFTISNGGTYGSLLSTPILNPPQSGILGMHTIQQRPVAIDGKVEIRPMMYLALSYDHRLVDGKEAVTFLIRIKECLENPTRLMLEM